MPARSPFVPVTDLGNNFTAMEHSPVDNTLQPFIKVLAIEWSMIVLTLALVATRLYIRIHHQRARSWSDVLVLVGWIFFFVQGCMDIEAYRLGAFRPEVLAAEPRWKVGNVLPPRDAVKVLRMQYVSEFTYYWTMYGMKASMLVFLYGLVPKTLKKTWIMLHITIIFTTVGFVVSMGLNLLYCRPIGGNWSLDKESYCDSVANYLSGGVAVFFHVISDLMIYILPFPVLHLLALSKPQKFGVGFIFALGFLCIAFALAVVLVVAFHGWGAIAFVCCVLEQTWAIFVVCAPAFKVFISRSRHHFFSHNASSTAKSHHGGHYGSHQHGIAAGGVGASISEDVELGHGIGRRVSLSMARMLGKGDDDVVELIPEGGLPRVVIRGIPIGVYAQAAGSFSSISKMSRDVDERRECAESKEDVIFPIKE